MAYTFILNDETIPNNYGSVIMNAGIDLQRFEANPVLLDNHSSSTSAVIGRWENIRIEGAQLKADAIFDGEDPNAKLIEGKVQRGFLKGVSMGIWFESKHVRRNPDDSFRIEKSLLYEASIVSVPSNANALKLYASDQGGKLLSNYAELKLSINKANTPIKKNMENITLSVGALNSLKLTAQPNTEIELNTAIANLAARVEAAELNLNTEKAAHAETQSALQLHFDNQAQALIDGAKAQGKELGDKEAEFLSLAKSNYQLAASVIGAIPTKISLSAMVNNSGSTAAAAGGEDRDNWTYADWQEKAPKALELMFDKEPEKFNKLING